MLGNIGKISFLYFFTIIKCRGDLFENHRADLPLSWLFRLVGSRQTIDKV